MPNDFPVFERITDSRCCLTLRHDLHDMLMMALLTVLSGGEPCLAGLRLARLLPQNGAVQKRWPCNKVFKLLTGEFQNSFTQDKK